MTDRYSIFFTLRNQEALRQIERLHLIVQRLVSNRYYLVAEEELFETRRQFNAWFIQTRQDAEKLSTSALPFQPGISPLVLPALENFCQTKVERCELGGFWVADNGPGRGFDFHISFYNDDSTLAVSFDQDFFTTIDHVEHYRHWLEAIKAIYNTGGFIYAYQLDHSGFHQPTLREELVTHGVTRLYPLNIFGLEPVQQLGRERLLAAPVSFIETLDDGSILLIPHASGAMRPEDRSYTDPGSGRRLPWPGVRRAQRG